MATLIFPWRVRGKIAAAVTNPAPEPDVTIITTSVPSGEVGQSYSRFLAATGGTSPYQWSVTSGTLPAGLALNAATGEISGTPTTAQFYTFTVQVIDAELGIDTQALTINVVPAIDRGSLHAFFNVNSSRPDCIASWTMRSQSQLEQYMQNKTRPILASTAANPSVLTGGFNPTSIVSSLNGAVTFSANHNADVGDTVFITGHDVAALNGVQTVASVQTNKIYTISGITGVGTAVGSGYQAEHMLSPGMLIDIEGHSAIADGRYVVATTPTNRTFTLETTTGASVSSTGGGVAGTFEGLYWEYFAPVASGGTGRTDPDEGQDGGKALLVKQNANLQRQLVLTDADDFTGDTVTSWDAWWSEEWHTSKLTTGTPLPQKTFRLDKGTTAPIVGPKIDFDKKYIPIGSIVSGGVGVAEVSTNSLHYFETGDQVVISGNSAVADGTYTATKIGTTKFTIPATVTSSGTGGNCREEGTFGRQWFLILGAGSPYKWVTGSSEADNFSFTGEGAVEQSDGAGFPIKFGKWTRWWVEIRRGLRGDEFDSWNAWRIQRSDVFGSGATMGLRNVTATVSGTTATFTCTSGPHGYQVGDTVEIESITGCNGTFLIDTVPASPTASSLDNGGFTGPTTFTITDAAISGSGGTGTAIMYFNMVSVWYADEDTNPTRMIYQVPSKYNPNSTLGSLRVEQDSSASGGQLAQLRTANAHTYCRNAFVLMDYPVSESDTTLFQRPVGV